MPIVHALGWYLPDSLGGTEVYVASLVRELRRAGADVCIAAPSPTATDLVRYEHEGTPVLRYPIPHHPTRAEARGECTARGAERFHEWLARLRPEVVHVHTFVTGLDLAEVKQARACGARVFVTSHSSALGYVCMRGTLLRWGSEPCDGVIDPPLCAACALQHRGVPRLLATAAAALPAKWCRIADRFDHPLGTALGMSALIERRASRHRDLFNYIERFFVLTDAARGILIANGAPAHKVRVNRLGVDTDAVRPIAHPARGVGNPITIGYLGRLDPIKGLDDLLRAIVSLDTNLPVRIDIRGVGADADAWRLRRAWEGVAARDARVTVGGAVARADVADVLTSWDVLCCPGRSLEGGPTVAIEAFAVGTPVIGTRFGGLAELVTDGHNGRLVPPGDWQALAAVIGDLAQNPNVIDQWRRRLPGVRSMRDVAADYLTAYQSCNSSKRSPSSACGTVAVTS